MGYQAARQEMIRAWKNPACSPGNSLTPMRASLLQRGAGTEDSVTRLSRDIRRLLEVPVEETAASSRDVEPSRPRTVRDWLIATVGDRLRDERITDGVLCEEDRRIALSSDIWPGMLALFVAWEVVEGHHSASPSYSADLRGVIEDHLFGEIGRFFDGMHTARMMEILRTFTTAVFRYFMAESSLEELLGKMNGGGTLELYRQETEKIRLLMFTESEGGSREVKRLKQEGMVEARAQNASIFYWKKGEERPIIFNYSRELVRIVENMFDDVDKKFFIEGRNERDLVRQWLGSGNGKQRGRLGLSGEVIDPKEFDQTDPIERTAPDLLFRCRDGARGPRSFDAVRVVHPDEWRVSWVEDHRL